MNNKPNLGSVAKVEWDGGSSRVGMLVILDFFMQARAGGIPKKLKL